MLALIVKRMSSPVWVRSVSPIAKASSLHKPLNLSKAGASFWGSPASAEAAHALHTWKGQSSLDAASACRAEGHPHKSWLQCYNVQVT